MNIIDYVKDISGDQQNKSGGRKFQDAAQKLLAPAVAHHFSVCFSYKYIPSLVDVQFQSISGLGRTLNYEALQQGGDNLRSYQLPKSVSHPNVVFERGVIVATPLFYAFNEMLGNFSQNQMNVTVILLNHFHIPVCSWTLTNAVPVEWSTESLDANSSKVLINKIELAYEKLIWRGIQA